MRPDAAQVSRLCWWHPQDVLGGDTRAVAARRVAVWAFISAFAVATGLLSTSWSGLPVGAAPFAINLTFYPPLTLCLLLTLWAGPVWGIVPAYLTSLVIALHQGMPLPTAAAFAFATPIALTVLWSCMVKLEVSPSLPTWPERARFVVLTLVATGASSVGALIWNYHHRLPFSEALAIWEGWVLGDFIQIVIIVGPLLNLFHRRVQEWLTSRVSAPPREVLATRFYIGIFFVVLAVMIAVGAIAASLFLSSLTDTTGESAAAAALARKTLGDAAFFLGVYSVVLLTSIVVFSYTLGREIERQLRDISERDRVQAEREKLIRELEAALSKVKALSGLLPICAGCKKIRDDKGYWEQIEVYIRDHSEADFSHGLCPECAERLFPGLNAKASRVSDDR